MFVLPRFKVFFAGLNAKLPLPTRMLLAMTDFIDQWWWALLAGAIVIGLASSRPRYAPNAGRYARDRIAAAPFRWSASTIQFALVERFCRILVVDGRRRRPAARGAAGGDRVAAQPGLHPRAGAGR